jgi:predicted nucleotidyltransferase
MQLTDEQLAIIITWAKKTPEVQAVFLYGSRAKGTAKPDSDMVLALSIKGVEATCRLAKFISHRRAWRAELEAALGLPVQLSRARRAHPRGGLCRAVAAGGALRIIYVVVGQSLAYEPRPKVCALKLACGDDAAKTISVA